MAALDACTGYDEAVTSDVCAAVASEGGTSAHQAHDQHYQEDHHKKEEE
jgi:hypothetical protein